MTALATTAPARPWEPQPGEDRASYVRFLAWAFTGDRAAPLPGALHQTALQFSWHNRAAVLDKRLRPTETVEEATSAIALDALQLVRSELEARTARSLQQPGHERLQDVVALLRLLGELGAFAGNGGPAAAEPDYSSLTPEEMTTLAAAGAILARLGAKRAC